MIVLRPGKTFEDHMMYSNQSAQTVRQANGWKSINNGVTAGGLFWRFASRSFSRFTRALVYRSCPPVYPPVLQANKTHDRDELKI